MKDQIVEKACAKLNLSLDVLQKRTDGFHEMRMVMQTVSLADEVRLSPTRERGVTVRSSFSFLPTDRRNIALRAAEVFFEAAGIPDAGLRIQLNKRIPVGAGLGGGSADAAAVLRGLNTLFQTGFSVETLEKLGEKLGSDVPFCVAGGTRLASGRGELLSPLPPLPECGVTICKPPFPIRTPELFARIDSRRSRVRPDTEGMVSALEEGDLAGVARRMYNVFEDVLPARCGEIGVIRQRLLDAGALGAVMTGTGSAVFGLFPDLAAAETAAAALRETYRESCAAVPVGTV